MAHQGLLQRQRARAIEVLGCVLAEIEAIRRTVRLARSGLVVLPHLRVGTRALVPTDPRVRAALRSTAGAIAISGLLGLLTLAAVLIGKGMQGPWRSFVDPVDRGFALWLHSQRSPALAVPMWSASWVGERGPMILVTSAIFLYLLWRRRLHAALCAAVCMIGTAVFWKLTSLMVQRPRPDYWLVHDASDPGYPGGHVMNAVVIAGVCLSASLPRLRRRWQRATVIGFWVAFIAVTFLCRVYVCAHFASDQLVGLFAGLVWIALAGRLCRWAFPGCRNQSMGRQ